MRSAFCLYITGACQRFSGILSALVLTVLLTSQFAGQANAESESTNSQSFSSENLEFRDPFAPCDGDCAIHVYGGSFLETGMMDVFGLYGHVAPWDVELEDSFLIGAAFNRRLVTAFDSFAIEAEVGVAQRFGPGATATEVWGAFFARWYNFPWNDVVYTTVAISTGVNYASTIDKVERERSFNTNNALHYLAPEITFADPDNKDTSLVVRLHHRSGGQFWDWTSDLFNDTAGGAQYLTLGIRKRF